MSRSPSPRSEGSSRDRGISPVLGTALLIAITVILVFSVGAFFVGVDTPSEEAPSAVVESSYDGSADELRLHHRGGDVLSGGELVVRNESAVLARFTPSSFGVGQTLEVNVSEESLTNSERLELWWIPDDQSATGVSLLSTPVSNIDGYDGGASDAVGPEDWQGQSIFALDDSADNTDARHRAAVHLESGDDVVGSSLGKVKIYYASTDVSNVEKADVIAAGFDTDGDGDIDVSVTDDLSGVSTENDGHTLKVDFGGSYSLEAGDTVVVRYDDATNPSAGDYSVKVEVNPQSGQTSDTGTLEIEN